MRRVHAVLVGTLAATLLAVFVSPSARAACAGNGTPDVVCSGVTDTGFLIVSATAAGGAPATVRFLSDFIALDQTGQFKIDIITTGSATLTFEPGATTERGPSDAFLDGAIARTTSATSFNVTLPSGASFGSFEIQGSSRLNINVGGMSKMIWANSSLPGSRVTVSGTVNRDSFQLAGGGASFVAGAIMLGQGDVVVNPGGRVNNPGSVAISIPFGGSVTNAGFIDGGVSVRGRVELRPSGVFNGNVVSTGGSAATFVLGGTGTGSFDLSEIGPKYQGFTGGLAKEGTSTWTVTGTNAGAAWTVSAGTLSVAAGADLGSNGVTVNGGTLGGNGTLGSTIIGSGGTLAPGNSIGTITVNGNLMFNAGGTYRVEVAQGAADRTNVTGTATLTGATVQVVPLGPLRAQTFTILNAAGGLGGTTFAGVSASGVVRNPRLTYDTNNVFLTVDTSALSVPAGASGSGGSIVGLINNAILNGVALPSGFNALFDLSGDALTNALDQLSGQGGHGATVTTAFTAAAQFLNTILDPSLGGRGGGTGGPTGYAEEARDALASASRRSAAEREAYQVVMAHHGQAPRADNPGGRWSVWASGYGGSSSVGGNAAAGTHTTTSTIYGTAVGADYRIGRDTLLGFAMGGAGTSFSTAQGLGGGHADLFQVGVYGRHYVGPAYIAGALGYGWQGVTTDRTVTVAGIDRLRADFSAHTFAARVETGTRFATPLMGVIVGVTPYAAAQFTSVHLPGYAETAVSGSNQFALAFGSDSSSNLRTELGIRTDKSFLMRDGLLTLRGRAAWAHDSNTDRAISPVFQSLPGAAFTVNGAEPAADGALISAGAEMRWWNGWTIAGTFEGEFSSTTTSYAGKGLVRRTW